MKEINLSIEKIGLLLPLIFVVLYIAISLFFYVVAPNQNNNLEVFVK